MENSQPVIFLPGLHCDERIWLPVWRKMALAQRCYVPLQWANNLSDMLALTSDRIDSCDTKVHLVGFSMGGYIASLAALKLPQKVAALTLVCYSPFGFTPQQINQRQQLMRHIQQGNYTGITARTLKEHLAAVNLDNATLVETFKSMTEDLGQATLAAQLKASTPREDLSQKLADSALKIHLIAGKQDRVAQAEQIQDCHQQLAGSTFDCIDNAGHMLPLEVPDTLGHILNQYLS